MKASDVLYIAFREAFILKRPQAVNSNNELADGLIYLNQQVDMWAARGCYAWTTTFLTYSLTAGHSPTRIGPGLTPPDFDCTPRPVRIHSAQLVLPGSSNVTININVRDSAWYQSLNVKNIESNVPTDLYYEPLDPNGALYFWPISNTGQSVILEVWVQLQQFATLADPFLAPPAYLQAVTLTLAEELCDLWGVNPPPNLARRAVKARDALQSNNNLPPRIMSADYGTMSSPGADWNWVTGTLP
jgi:hypothetical protein